MKERSRERRRRRRRRRRRSMKIVPRCTTSRSISSRTVLKHPTTTRTTKCKNERTMKSNVMMRAKKNEEDENVENIMRALYGREEKVNIATTKEKEKEKEMIIIATKEEEEEYEFIDYEKILKEKFDDDDLVIEPIVKMGRRITSWDIRDFATDDGASVEVMKLGVLIKEKWELGEYVKIDERTLERMDVIEEYETSEELKSVRAGFDRDDCYSSGDGTRDTSNDEATTTNNNTNWLRVENVCLKSKNTFRKMHCELAWGPMDFVVLHVVIYPYAIVNAPIFAGDIVGFRGRVSLSIVDLAPTNTDAPAYDEAYDALIKGLESRKKVELLPSRDIPEWGESILSSRCVCVAGDKAKDKNQKQFECFKEYFLDVMDVYLRAASNRANVSDVVKAYESNAEIVRNIQDQAPPPSFALSDALNRKARQIRFCERQLSNEKTRVVLERAMGEAVADRYMREVLFDVNENTKLFS